MKKTILITGSTDGLGLETALILAKEGHDVLLHGRSATKLAAAKETHPVLAQRRSFVADFSITAEVEKLATEVAAKVPQLDVLINNAGVFKAPETVIENGLDLRFMVNTIAPYLLTSRLLATIPRDGRVLNISSAAQAPVSEQALKGEIKLSDNEAYAQSKLAIAMWSNHLAGELADGPVVIAVNPGSLLGTKMVRDAYGMAGKDIAFGARALAQLAIDDAFAQANGRYFDNDRQAFGSPHGDALDTQKRAQLVKQIEQLLAQEFEGTA